ncbi:hypothetical protein [Aquibium carbonis]|nr:hypothetical protein [Aquibium carbonis]
MAIDVHDDHRLVLGVQTKPFDTEGRLLRDGGSGGRRFGHSWKT